MIFLSIYNGTIIASAKLANLFPFYLLMHPGQNLLLTQSDGLSKMSTMERRILQHAITSADPPRLTLTNERIYFFARLKF